MDVVKYAIFVALMTVAVKIVVEKSGIYEGLILEYKGMRAK